MKKRRPRIRVSHKKKNAFSFMTFVITLIASFIFFALIFLFIFSAFPDKVRVQRLFEKIGFPQEGEQLTGRQISDEGVSIAGHSACDDGTDNDGDGLIDLRDPNCMNTDDTNEAGVTYYVCDCQTGADAQCAAGNINASDSNAGTSPSAPWRTYDRARSHFSSTLQAGQTIAFCDGGSFSVGADNEWSNTRCLAGNPCVTRNYRASWASGDESKPIITQSSAGGTGSSAVFNFAGGSSFHREGYTFMNLNLRGPGVGWAVFISNDVDDTVLDNLTIENFGIGVYIGTNNGDIRPGSDGKNDRTTLRNSRIISNRNMGWLGGGNDDLIENNYFEDNGEVATLDHNLYYNSHGKGAIIRGNELYRSTMVAGVCRGVPLVVHGEVANLTIENNYVHEDIGGVGAGCWGIAVDSGYSTPEHFPGLVIRGNIVENVRGLAIGCNACSDVLIENNVIIHEQADGIQAIMVPDPQDTTAGENALINNVNVRHNSIFISSSASSSLGIFVSNFGSGHSIENNAIYYSGTHSGWRCLVANLPVGNYDAIRNNICYYPNSPGGQWEDGGGNLTAWRTATGFDSGSINSNPLFTSTVLGNYDLSLQAGSPAIDAGIDAGVNEDINGNSRPAGAGFDMGAYEFNAVAGAVCGNNIAESGEACDGSDLRGQSCVSQGFNSGTLSCRSDCLGFDTSGCVSAPDTTPPSVSITSPSAGTSVFGSVTVSATASDNVVVSGVQFLLDGANLGAEDTSSPYSVSWNTASATLGSHTLSARARDSSGNTATSSPVSVNVVSAPACLTSNTGWTNTAFATQTGVFTAEFDAAPNNTNMNGITALSFGGGTTFSNFNVLFGFNSSNDISACNGVCAGGAYQSVNRIIYTPGTEYHFRAVIDIPNRRYDAYVTPSGGSEILLADDFAFRSDSPVVTELNNWGLQAGSGTHTVCNFIVSGAPQPQCTFTNAYWNTISAIEGDTLTLTVEGSNCDGQTAAFAVWEDDVMVDNLAEIQPANSIFSGGRVTASWVAEDGDIIGDSEFYFIASLSSNPSTTLQSGLVSVSEISSITPTVNILSPLDGATVASSEVDIDFSVSDWTVGGKGSEHIHFHLDNVLGYTFSDHFMFYNGADNIVEFNLNSGATAFATWIDPDTIRFHNVPNGVHNLRVHLADATHNTLGNPEADKTIQFSVSASVPCTDRDNDGYGTGDTSSCPNAVVDCNDSNSGIFPGSPETCNSIDDDCDSQVDENLLNTYYRNADSDLYGNATSPTQACTQPVGYSLNNLDCNDNDANLGLLQNCYYNGAACGAYQLCVAPGSCPVPPAEICGNLVDENCDGRADPCSSNIATLIVINPVNGTYRNRPTPIEFRAANTSNCWYTLNSYRFDTPCVYSTYRNLSQDTYDFTANANNSQGITSVNRRFTVRYTRKYLISYGRFIEPPLNTSNLSASTSGVYRFTPLSHNNGRGHMTTNLDDLTDAQLEAVSNLILDDGIYGKIEWLEPVNLTQGADPLSNIIDLDSHVPMDFNRIEVKSDVIPTLNKRARVMIYGVIGLNNPRISRDGEICTSCVVESYDAVTGDLVFTVPGFSVYSAESTPLTGEPPSGGGPGGPGGGSPGGTTPRQNVSNGTQTLPGEQPEQQAEEEAPVTQPETPGQVQPIVENVKKNKGIIIAAVIILVVLLSLLALLIRHHHKKEIKKITEQFNEQFSSS